MVTGLLCVAGALGSVATMRRFSLFGIVCAWLGTGAMVCWSGYTLLVAAVDADVAAATPLPLTALAAVGRTYLSSGAGYVAKATGWPLFFAICVVVAVPSLLLLAWLQRRGHFAALQVEKI